MVASAKGHTAAAQEVHNCVHKQLCYVFVCTASIHCKTPPVSSHSEVLSWAAVQLLKAGAQVHHVSKDGRSTALHEAVLRNHIHIADLLLRASANPFLENAAGKLLLCTFTIHVNVIFRRQECPHTGRQIRAPLSCSRMDMCVSKVRCSSNVACTLLLASTGSLLQVNMPKQCRLQ